MSEMPEITWGINPGLLHQYQRDLPHWRQEGAVYFVTFRLADSIPREVMQAWLEDRQTWLAAHSITPGLPQTEHHRQYTSIPQEQRRAFERDHARRYFRELDLCHGACHLRNPQAAIVVGDALRYHHPARLLCGDYVIMPNHVHWLLLPLEGHALEDILYSIKRWTAGRINTIVGRTGKLWKKESFDHIVRSPEEFDRIRDYIEQNPGKARLGPGEYLYHRADWA